MAVTLNAQPTDKKVYSLVISSLEQQDVEAFLQLIYDNQDKLSPEVSGFYDIDVYETTKIAQV